MTQFLTIAWPDNDRVLQDIFAVRREHAALLGYASWADFDAEVKMIGSGPAIGEFVDRITELSTASAERDKAVLLDRLRQDRPDATDIDGADSSYYAELVRKEQLAVDAQRVRTYFSFEAVRQGLLDVTGRLFGLEWVPVPADEARTWHAEVETYDVSFGGERSAASTSTCTRATTSTSTRRSSTWPGEWPTCSSPEGVLVCNFPNRGLLEHDEVVTFFHEFGHLVHHVLGRTHRVGCASRASRRSGTSSRRRSRCSRSGRGTRRSSRRSRATPTVRPSPPTSSRRCDGPTTSARATTRAPRCSMRRCRMTSTSTRQTTSRPRLRELMARYSVFPYMDGTHMQCHFGHLDGYSSAYYTYMWSLVIAKDMFSAFDRDDLFDPEVAGAYRDRVLAPGGQP